MRNPHRGESLGCLRCEAPVVCNGCNAWHALGMAKAVTRVP